MKVREIISELRKNPEQNVKLSNKDQLIAVREKYGSENVYARFVNDPKFGVNPSYSFNTPLGIYAYPIDYLIENFDKLFGSAYPYLYVFKADSNLPIWDVNNTPVDDVLKDKMTAAIVKVLRIDPDMVKNVIDAFTTPSELYNFMYSCIGQVFDRGDKNSGKGGVHGKSNAHDSALAARKIIKAMGFSGAFDLGGYGVIASQYKVQVVFFDKKGLSVLDLISRHTDDNPYVRPDIDSPSAPPIKSAKQASKAFRAGYSFNNIPEEFRDYNLCMRAVKQNEWYLQYVPPNMQAEIKDALNKPDELSRVTELVERLNK